MKKTATFEIVTKTVSLANQREHWRTRAKRAKEERWNAAMSFKSAVGRWRPNLPAAVTMTRVSPGKLDDDNLRGALKSIRDGIADVLKVDDGNELVNYHYLQEKSPKPGYYSVKVRIEEV